MSTKPQVIGLQVKHDGRATYAELTLQRLPDGYVSADLVATPADLPPDFRAALLAWLGAGSLGLKEDA